MVDRSSEGQGSMEEGYILVCRDGGESGVAGKDAGKRGYLSWVL